MNIEKSFRTKIRKYRARIAEIMPLIENRGNEWGRFQSEFNQEINNIFREIMLFEKNALAQGDENKVYKFKKFFRHYFQSDFLKGEYIRWSFEKPCGYAGDFQIIDNIYLNLPKTTGVGRLFDNYFLASPASVATRNRKEDFKRIIYEVSRRHEGRFLALDLASGPCRDLKEFYRDFDDVADVSFVCFENDLNAIEYAKKTLGTFRENVSFVRENVVRLALKKNVEDLVPHKFECIFSTGLFDYLEYKIGVRLLANLKKLLKPDGVMIISNYRDKYSNPGVHFMEWVGEWNLVYRDEIEFGNMFIDAGFSAENLKFEYEQQGIMQYCFAYNRI